MSALLECVRLFPLQRLVLYAAILITSFFVIIPMAELQNNFGGQCLLYAHVNYSRSSSSEYLYFGIQFGAASVCQYNIAVAATFSLIYAGAAAGIYGFLFLRERQERKIDLAHVVFLVHCCVDVGVCVLILVSACTISVGFSRFCQQIMKGVNHGVPLDSCSQAQGFHDWRGHDGGNFHVCLSVAVVGSWLNFVFWLLQTILGVWKLWRLNMLPTIPEKLRICCKKE